MSMEAEVKSWKFAIGHCRKLCGACNTTHYVILEVADRRDDIELLPGLTFLSYAEALSVFDSLAS